MANHAERLQVHVERARYHGGWIWQQPIGLARSAHQQPPLSRETALQALPTRQVPATSAGRAMPAHRVQSRLAPYPPSWGTCAPLNPWRGPTTAPLELPLQLDVAPPPSPPSHRIRWWHRPPPEPLVPPSPGPKPAGPASLSSPRLHSLSRWPGVSVHVPPSSPTHALVTLRPGSPHARTPRAMRAGRRSPPPSAELLRGDCAAGRMAQRTQQPCSLPRR